MSIMSEAVQPKSPHRAAGSRLPAAESGGVLPSVSFGGDGRCDRGPAADGAARVLRAALTAGPLALSDAAVAFTATAAGAIVAGVAFPGAAESSLSPSAVGVLVPAVFWCFGLYPGTMLHPADELRRLSLAVSAGFSALTVGAFSVGVPDGAPVPLGTAIAIAFAAALAGTPLARWSARAVLGRRAWWGERALVIGDGPAAAACLAALRSRPGLGVKPVGVAATPGAQWASGGISTSPDYVGPSEESAEIARRYGASWAVVATAGMARGTASGIRGLTPGVPNVLVLREAGAAAGLWAEPRECGGRVGLLVRDGLTRPAALAAKRLIDVAVVVAGGLPLLPLLFAVALAIKLTSPGPVFYGQERIGRGGRRFRAWKFRSMVPDAAAALERHLASDPALRAEWERDQKLRRDPRVIPVVGPLLRTSSLDELPQLWNVLRGEMSLVGPRPIVDAEVPRYGDAFDQYLRATPGMTGLWQVSGRNDTTYPERVRLDAFYVQNWSFWLDLVILARTVVTILRREGAC